MTYLSSKRNVLCELHNTTLINAAEREGTCNSGIIELYRCCNFGCK